MQFSFVHVLCDMAMCAQLKIELYLAMAFLTTFSRLCTLFQHWYKKIIVSNQFVHCQQILNKNCPSNRLLIVFKFVNKCGRALFYWVCYKIPAWRSFWNNMNIVLGFFCTPRPAFPLRSGACRVSKGPTKGGRRKITFFPFIFSLYFSHITLHTTRMIVHTCSTQAGAL